MASAAHRRLDLHQLLYLAANSGSRMAWRVRGLRESAAATIVLGAQEWRCDTVAPAESRSAPSRFLFEPHPDCTVRRSWLSFRKSRNGRGAREFPSRHSLR